MISAPPGLRLSGSLGHCLARPRACTRCCVSQSVTQLAGLSLSEACLWTSDINFSGQ